MSTLACRRCRRPSPKRCRKRSQHVPATHSRHAQFAEGGLTEHAHSFEEIEEESGRPAHPCIMVIFGACGDLTKRKLIPALYNLAKSDLLPRNFAIIGVSLQDSSSEA